MTLKRTVDVKFRMTMVKIGACHVSCPQALEESCLINAIQNFMAMSISEHTCNKDHPTKIS